MCGSSYLQMFLLPQLEHEKEGWGESEPSRPRLQTTPGTPPDSHFWPPESELLWACLHITLQKIPHALFRVFVMQCQEKMYLYKQWSGILLLLLLVFWEDQSSNLLL